MNSLSTSVRRDDAFAGAPIQGFTHSAFPVPASEEVAITCVLPQMSQIPLTIHDAFGQIVATLADGHYQAGEPRFLWQNVQCKGYWYRLTTASGVYGGKIVPVNKTCTRTLLPKIKV